MRRIAWPMVLIGLLVAACGPQSAATPTSTVNPPTSTATSTPSPTGESAVPTAPAPVTEELIQRAITVQPDDWVRGPDTARVTIIEWGDFQ
ncbi:MAG TPA: hypothetical protein VIK33_17850 [Anaerolineae bacterium]